MGRNKNLTSATDVNRTNACDKSHRSKYFCFIPFTVEGQSESAGFSISHNPHLAMAIVHFLQSYLLENIRIYRSARSGLQEVVNYLKTLKIQKDKLQNTLLDYRGHNIQTLWHKQKHEVITQFYRLLQICITLSLK